MWVHVYDITKQRQKYGAHKSSTNENTSIYNLSYFDWLNDDEQWFREYKYCVKHCSGRIVNHVLDRAEITKQLDPSLHMKVAIDRIRAWKLCFAGAHVKKRTADLFNSPLPQFCSCSPLAVPPLTLKIRTKFSEPLLELILEPHTHALVLM